MSRSIKRGPASFDIGPHRFFSKSQEVVNLWRDYLGKDLISVARLTRIVYRDKFFNYPLSPLNALFGLGLKTSVQAFASYCSRKVVRGPFRPDPATLEEWVTDNFGRVLYDAFFKHYTEKVWGIPCSDISVDWASQRIKGLNLTRAVLNALTMHKTSKIKTLADTFLYPGTGAGTPYQRMMQRICGDGGQYVPKVTVTGIERIEGR